MKIWEQKVKHWGHKAFTLIELMLVIAIIGILISLVTGVSTGAIRNARLKRAQVLAFVVKQGLETYHAQKGEWPGPFGARVKADTQLETGSNSGVKDIKNKLDEVYVLTEEEVDGAMVAMLKEARNGNPFFDPSALYIAKKGSNSGAGMDFLDAIHGTKRHPKKMTISEMKFGYCASNGRFKRFRITYSPPTEQIDVTMDELY